MLTRLGIPSFLAETERTRVFELVFQSPCHRYHDPSHSSISTTAAIVDATTHHHTAIAPPADVLYGYHEPPDTTTRHGHQQKHSSLKTNRNANYRLHHHELSLYIDFIFIIHHI
ncbi:hypothetical protein L2E82_09036 [Cichorium intybus]|uniref:Uncharacterized protein n=1 Tax=Cichorium intybus TaxID=13427 RepID=A0ACB9G8I0_CICIN|nr:hypothetical protein L2E82_09036 [Cichorium intybus]